MKRPSQPQSPPKSPTLIIGATNLPQLLDPALLHPGRFGHHIYVGLPDFWNRVELMLALLGLSVCPQSTSSTSTSSFESLTNVPGQLPKFLKGKGDKYCPSTRSQFDA